MIILDRDMLDYMDRLAPEMGVFDLSTSWTFSNNIQMPPPVVTTLAAYIEEIPMPPQDGEALAA